MSKGAIQGSPPRLSAQIFAPGSVSERTQSSSARVQNRHHSRPRASAVCASNKESTAAMSYRHKTLGLRKRPAGKRRSRSASSRAVASDRAEPGLGDGLRRQRLGCLRVTTDGSSEPRSEPCGDGCFSPPMRLTVSMMLWGDHELAVQWRRKQHLLQPQQPRSLPIPRSLSRRSDRR
jgi:hypothetical protein